VSAGRVPLFKRYRALAGRVERVEAQLIARSSEASAAGRARRAL